MASRRVAIIGGGSAGIVQAHELLVADLQPTIFERRNVLGSGIWATDQDPGECHILFDANGRAFARWEETETRKWPPSAIYPGLRTNTARDVMSYRDSPFIEQDADGPFPDRSSVDKYLQSWAKDKEGVTRCARLNTTVTSIRRVRHPGHDQANGSGSLWQVESQSTITGVKSIDEFEYIVIASGRCSIPSIAPIPGLWNFKGTILHSAWYRSPTPYRNQKVVVVGNNSSGFDICRELRGYIVRDFQGKEDWIRDVESGSTGVQLFNSVEDINQPPRFDYDPREESSPDWCRTISVVPRISKVEGDGSLLLEDGQLLRDVDVIIFATGFYVQYDFLNNEEEPFKSFPIVESPKQSQLSKEDASCLRRRIQEKQSGQAFTPSSPANSGPSNLDDWFLFYNPDISLAILGLPTASIPFPTSQIQSRYIAAYWAGKAKELPPLDRSLPPSDASRWVNPLALTKEEMEKRGNNAGPMNLIFGSPSDSDYLDAMLSYLPDGGGKPPWETEALQAAQEKVEELNGRILSASRTELCWKDRDASQHLEDIAASKAELDSDETKRTSASLEEAREHYLSGVKSNLMGGPEGSYDVTAWRRQRRTENRELRRKTLGY